MRIAIVGGGIGGLSAALTLSRTGHSVTIHERTPEPSRLGAGLQVSANARRVLHHLGLTDELDRIVTEPSRIVLRRWNDDTEIAHTMLHGVHEEKFGTRYANVSRADLLGILVDAVDAEDSIDLRFGSIIDGPESIADHDVVVGADGIHSRVREHVVGADEPRFSGTAAFRAQVPREALAHLAVETTNRLGPGAHVVSYFIGRNQSHHNLVFVAPQEEPIGESWTQQADVAELRAAFAGWSDELSTIIELVEEPVYKWALYDREPLKTWTKGAVTLLGDAAHPMLPFMAQGACQAIEDAAVLARCLDGVDAHDAPRALLTYEANRIDRTARIQTGSYRNRIAYHLPDGEQQEARDAAFASSSWGDALDWLYGHDPLSVPLLQPS